MYFTLSKQPRNGGSQRRPRFIRDRGRVRVLALGMLGSLCLLGCTEVKNDRPGGVALFEQEDPQPMDPATYAKTIGPNQTIINHAITPRYGYKSKTEKFEYYYMGQVAATDGKVPINPIYFFYDKNDQPLFALAEDKSQLVGWHPVVDSLANKPGYSPYLQVHKVRVNGATDPAKIEALVKTVDIKQLCQMDASCDYGQVCLSDHCVDPIEIGDYALDGIKSFASLKDSGLTIEKTQTVLNCPIVDLAASVEPSITGAKRSFPRIQVWFERLQAFCLLMEGGDELLKTGGPKLTGADQMNARDAYLIHQFFPVTPPKGPEGSTELLRLTIPKRLTLIVDGLPGAPEYSPLLRENLVAAAQADPDYRFTVFSSAEINKDTKLEVKKQDRFHNVVIVGTLPTCTKDSDCKASDKDLSNNLWCLKAAGAAEGLCGLPPARLYDPCIPGLKECSATAGPQDSPLVCAGLVELIQPEAEGGKAEFKLTGDEPAFCLNACDPSADDTDADPALDSRCASTPGFTCLGWKQSDSGLPSGLCVRTCDPAAEGDAATAQCANATCGNGTLELGEACDDNNTKSGDGCNATCTFIEYARCLSATPTDCDAEAQSCQTQQVFTGQPEDYCVPKTPSEEEAEGAPYQIGCAALQGAEKDATGYCWPPAKRAAWLSGVRR